MSLKNYPYEFSDDYEKLYNFLMEYQNYFIFGISDNDYEKIFKIRNVLENNVNAICFTDDNIYKKFALNHDEFLKICMRFCDILYGLLLGYLIWGDRGG